MSLLLLLLAPRSQPPHRRDDDRPADKKTLLTVPKECWNNKNNNMVRTTHRPAPPLNPREQGGHAQGRGHNPNYFNVFPGSKCFQGQSFFRVKISHPAAKKLGLSALPVLSCVRTCLLGAGSHALFLEPHHINVSSVLKLSSHRFSFKCFEVVQSSLFTCSQLLGGDS